MTYLHIDLCCGLGGWQAPFEEDPQWRSIGLDVRDDLAADVVADVRQLPLRPCEPDLVTASPPCQPYSTAWNRWTPLGERDPDTSMWDGCRDAIRHLEPRWWVLENVAGAQHWFGGSVRNVGPYHLWGDFPPVDFPAVSPKGSHGVTDGGGMAGATVPYPIANAIKRAVEVWT